LCDAVGALSVSKDCFDVWKTGNGDPLADKVYTIHIGSKNGLNGRRKAWCDMHTEGGGWTVCL